MKQSLSDFHAITYNKTITAEVDILNVNLRILSMYIQKEHCLGTLLY